MKYLIQISRILIGIVFIFSGFVKGVDPLGSMYKFNEYFEFLGLSSLESFSLPLAIILSTSEFIIGVCLFTGIRMRIASWALLIFAGFFTVLTFILAIFNPITDCGCFGDAVVISNWQTFLKNIVLMVFVLIIFSNRQRFDQLYKTLNEWIMVIFYAIILTGISVYCLQHLPLFDFRPYRIGTFIPYKMKPPKGAPREKYDVKIYYKKNGIERAFNSQSLPDSTWKFVRSESKLIQKGYVPPIHDFVITSVDSGIDVTNDLLQDENYTFLLIAYDLKKANLTHSEQINQITDYARRNGYNFMCVTASLENEIEEYKKLTKADYNFYNADMTMLKTMIRSNPGLILLKKGTVIGMWSHNDLPEIKMLQVDLLGAVIDSYRKKYNRVLIACLSFGLFTLALLFHSIHRRK